MSNKIPVSDEAMKKIEEANKKKAKATPELAALLGLAQKKERQSKVRGALESYGKETPLA